MSILPAYRAVRAGVLLAVDVPLLCCAMAALFLFLSVAKLAGAELEGIEPQ